MMNPTFLRCVILLWAALASAAQTPSTKGLASPTPALPASANLATSTPNPETPIDSAHYSLGPDDQIKVWVLGADEIMDKPVRINPEGDIDLPVVGRIHVAGMTVEQLKVTLTDRFAPELLHPQVSV